MALGALASTILTFAAIVGVGAALRASGLLSAKDAHPLNTVIIYVGLPAFIFSAVHGAQLSAQLWRGVLVGWLAFLGALAVASIVSRLLRLSRLKSGGFLLAASLGNTGYIGYPITAAFLGAAAVPTAVFYDIFVTVFALVLVGLPIAARLGEHGEGYPHPVRELITFPAVIALALALLLRPVTMPQMVSVGLELVASMVAPLIMLSVGLSLRPRSVAAAWLPLGALSLVKLLIAPLIAVLTGSLLLSGPAFQVAVLEASMPSMMLTYVVGERYGLDTEFIAAAVFVTTVASALSVPLIQAAVF